MERLWAAGLAGLVAATVAAGGCGAGGAANGSGSGTPSSPSNPCANYPLPVVSSVVASPSEVGLESVTEFTITAQGIGVCGYADIVWDFGDGTTASAKNVGNRHTVTHIYTSSRSYAVRASVTDSGGRTGTTFLYGLIVSNMDGGWVSTDSTGRTRTMTLKQDGAIVSGEYTSAAEAIRAAVAGNLATPKAINLDVSGGTPPVVPMRFSGAVSADGLSFTGLFSGGAADGKTLTFTKQ